MRNSIGSIFGARVFHSDMDDLSGVVDGGDAGSEGQYDYTAYDNVGEDQPDQSAPEPQPEATAEEDPYGEQEFLSAIDQMRGGGQQQPDPYQQPQQQQYQQPGPQLNQLHAYLLNPQTRPLIEANLHQSYDNLYRTAPTQEAQQRIAAEYNLKVAELNMELRSAQQAQREWEHGQREMQFQQTMLPRMRRALIDDLVGKHGLTPKEVAFDRATGQPITDPNLMRKQAEWLGSMKTDQRVQTRRQQGVDRPYNASGGARGGKSVMQMSDREFEQLERDAQRRGNRAFTGLG